MRVLGIDPGFGRMGWAVLEGNRARQRVVAYGCIETSASDSLDIRLEEIYDGIRGLIEEYKPEQAAVEELFYFKNQKTVMAVGQARGVILLAIVKGKVAGTNYTPLQVKRAVTGYGQADKNQVQLMVKTLLKLKEVPKPDDAADACGVALAHMFMDQGLMRKGK